MDIYDSVEMELINFNSEINIHNITHDDMKNGNGLRVVLWVAGCSHHCPECHNPITWDPDGGIPFTQWEEAEFWEWLDKPWTEGATFSGGDPLHPRNRKFIGNLIRKIKETRPGKNIWVYTGYSLKKTDDGFIFEDENGDTFELPELKFIDVLIDGRFECKVRELDIQTGKQVHWRGSSNQRIIDVPNSLKSGNISELKEE